MSYDSCYLRIPDTLLQSSGLQRQSHNLFDLPWPATYRRVLDFTTTLIKYHHSPHAFVVQSSAIYYRLMRFDIIGLPLTGQTNCYYIIVRGLCCCVVVPTFASTFGCVSIDIHSYAQTLRLIARSLLVQALATSDMITPKREDEDRDPNATPGRASAAPSTPGGLPPSFSSAIDALTPPECGDFKCSKCLKFGLKVILKIAKGSHIFDLVKSTSGARCKTFDHVVCKRNYGGLTRRWHSTPKPLAAT